MSLLNHCCRSITAPQPEGYLIDGKCSQLHETCLLDVPVHGCFASKRSAWVWSATVTCPDPLHYCVTTLALASLLVKTFVEHSCVFKLEGGRLLLSLHLDICARLCLFAITEVVCCFQFVTVGGYRTSALSFSILSR